MGASKREYEEICMVEMTKEFYDANEVIFDTHCVLKAAFVRGGDYKNDTRYQELFAAYETARTELREYEYEQHYREREHEKVSLTDLKK